MFHGDTTSQPRNCSTVKADSLTAIIQFTELYNAGTVATAAVSAFLSLFFLSPPRRVAT